jgi:divalent metal cation (Fe/Co/Zn/Cd) transporter
VVKESQHAGLRRARRLEYFTLVYNGLEALISVWAGAAVGSVALTGFGLDSVVEVTSGAALLWRLRHNADVARRERAERIALRTVGWCFAALALYVAYESSRTLMLRDLPGHSIPGIVVAAASVVVMPLLARAKRRAASAIGSNALHADSRQADFCAWLSAILLAGLLLNLTLGWWWADPVAGLIMVPIIAREALGALRGESCGCDHAQ